ncbi:MAG: hypothetical protein SAJ12_06575 [Jaaginema sp. PMC 1079.18]|nr:hypothetical protein [Jaaginema sp. PMC 1080.18]MEC4850658.1 hypothetical protein [Jaaginema sp. PMC 1079.18]MEC4866668.1 hypothetical protein [Jaaginema sp. PMC 1078.18]
MKVTKHRDRILEALQEWFRLHQQGPTLEELCIELGMKPRQKATLQRWLQTMRGIDVEWEDNIARSLRLLREEPEEPKLQIPVTETLRYLTTGLVEWDEQKQKQTSTEFPQPPQALRIGMSRMYLTSLLQGNESPPSNLPEFFEWAKKPIAAWQPASEIKYLSPSATLIEDGAISDFTLQWAVEGVDLERQIEEKVLEDVLYYCREHQLENEYRHFRKLIITQPVIPFSDYRRLLSSSSLRSLRPFLSQTYMNLIDLVEEESYHFCPRCKYIQRRRPDGTYTCLNSWCSQLTAKLNLSSLPPIPKKKAKDFKAVTFGVHKFGVLPGIWEIKLAEELSKLGLRVTLWPAIDEFDLLVEFSKKVRWSIDLKDWSYLDEDRLRKVQFCFNTTQTFVVFPDEREDILRVKVVRQYLESSLEGVRLKLMSEVISEAKSILKKG